jgi:hypothetical protein
VTRYPLGVVWEAIFLLAVLKIPVIYVSLVAWWAIRAEPEPFDGLETARARLPAETDPRPGARLRGGPGRPTRGNGPHGRPLRTYSRRPARVTA